MAQNVFSSCVTITVGCFLYTDAGLTNPAPNGLYSDGVNVFTVSGGLGQVTAVASCGSFTTTTTTTAPYGTFSLTNTSADLDISGLTIGGSSVVVTSGAFPSTPLTGSIGGQTQLIVIPGTHTVTVVGVTSGTSGQIIRVTDSNGAVQQQSIGNPFSGDVTFTGVFINTTTQILIQAL